MTRNRYYQGPPSDHYDGSRFFNPGHPRVDRSLRDLLRWRAGGKRTPWTTTAVKQTIPAGRVAGLSVTLIGHASLLLQVNGCNILVDPVWSARASPLGSIGPHRFNAPGVAFETLPQVDTVLLTHNHYDHLDIRTLRRLWHTGRPRIVAPLGNDRVINRTDPAMEIQTLDWGQRTKIGSDVEVWLHPANHWSSRGLRDRRMALWGGFVIKSPAGSIYVSGDTGYGDGSVFRDVLARHGPSDVAILPIGAYEPRWFMANQHVDPAEAVRIMQDCGAKQALGVHWGTFALTDEPQDAPREDLRGALARAGIADACFLAMLPGDSWTRPED